ncbi:MAG: M28 family peptidase [Chitinophagales bacterium]
MLQSKIIAILFPILIISHSISAQDINKLIQASSVERIERMLSSDAMMGRRVFTPGIERAADSISREFKLAGLKPFDGNKNFLQKFNLLKSKLLSAEASFDGLKLAQKDIVPLSASEELTIDNHSGFEKRIIHAGENFRSAVLKYINPDKNYLVLMDTSFGRNFPRLAGLMNQQFKSAFSVIFVLSSADPNEYQVHVRQEISESGLANVVGIIPGKSRKKEFVIFSAHYDHLGIGKPNAQQDSIFNGANDDASGTTAVIALANYFGKTKMNERTLVFAAFTAEEVGEFGSQYFSRQFDPAQVVAMFNIEMIGTESKWGTQSAYLTGYERTDMGKILEKNLAETPFKFYPDPYPEQQLFFRSDNASLARLGVPAHSISTSKMDSEKYYHTQADEIGTLNMKNMTEIIKAIAISSASIVSGRDTPSRVDTKSL